MRGLARSTLITDSGGARNLGPFNDSYEELDRLASGRAALCEALAQVGVQSGLKKMFIAGWMELIKLWEVERAEFKYKR